MSVVVYIMYGYDIKIGISLLPMQCTDSVSDSQLPTVQYNFRHIADLENVEPNQLVGKFTILHGYIYCYWSEFDISANYTMGSLYC